MEGNHLARSRSAEQEVEYISPSHKKQKIDSSAKSHSSENKKSGSFDANSENRNPLSVLYLEEMGLGVLDTDESSSNQSFSRNTTISSQPSSVPPASAFSLAMSDNCIDTLQGVGDESETECNEDSPNAIGNESSADNFPSISYQSDLLTDFILSDSNSNENEPKTDITLVSLQDNTPANLIPVSRTAFGVLASNSGAESTISNNSFRAFECGTGNGTQPEGRAIRNTSLVKFSTSNAIQKHKGRSPLATVSCNSNNNLNTVSFGINEGEARANADIPRDDAFFMYHKQDPRIYKGEDNFNTLSDEMILSVFKWLPKKTLIRCSLVSHRFHRVSQDESLWTRLDLAGKVLQPQALGRIIMRGVVILRLAQCKILEPIFKLSELPNPKFMTKLQYLDLSMAVINTSGLMELFSRCTRLKKVSLEHVPLNDAVCKELANSKQLEVLNLAMCTGITKYGVRKLMSSLKCLQSINISWTSLDTDSIIEFATHVNENLIRLNIAGCRKTMTDAAVAKIVNRCPGLRELDLSDCTVLTSLTIDIVCNLKKLEYLSLSRCYSINVAAYLEINKLVSIAYLDIFGVLSEQALAVLKNSFPDVGINKFIHSAVARPTVGSRRTSIWGIRTRD